MRQRPDPALDALLDLDGVVIVIDEASGHWVKFAVTRVPATQDRPHGLAYSLTMHGAKGERLVGYDNAHAVAGRSGKTKDHRHRLRSVRPYEFKDAAALLEDFWSDVESVLREKGVKP